MRRGRATRSEGPWRARECARCHRPFLACPTHGGSRRYCSERCSEQARIEAHRDAVRTYQGSEEGREQHCDQQRRYRERRKTRVVTDKSVCSVQTGGRLRTSSVESLAVRDDGALGERSPHVVQVSLLACVFCHRAE